MKIMSQLTVIASDLYESVSTEINEPTKTLIAEFLEYGEEGLAVDYILDWAIESNRSISDALWAALVDYFAPLSGELNLMTRERLSHVSHAA
jgi:hypothetical protein